MTTTLVPRTLVATEPPLLSLQRSTRAALARLQSLAPAATPLLSITTLALECSCQRAGADPLAIELGWRELRRQVFEALVQARGPALAADPALFDDYLEAVDASAVCLDLRDLLARRLGT